MSINNNLISRYQIYLLFLLLPVSYPAATQTVNRYNSFSYNVNEGLLQSTMQDIAFDNNNFCWLSFPNGIQKFDGKNFISIPVQAGLPDDKMVFFFECSNGDLLVSHSEGISKYEIKADRFIQVYTNSSLVKKPASFIGEDETVIWFCSERTITGIDMKSFKIVKQVKDALPPLFNSDYRPKISENIINHKVAIIVHPSLYLWDLQKGKLISRSDSIPHMSPFLLLLRSEDEALYYTYKVNNALHAYNFSNHTTTLLPVEGKDNRSISRCVFFNWGKKPLVSFTNNIYETDPQRKKLGAELVNFQNESIAGPAGIWRMRQDKLGNLYVMTVTSGFIKVIRDNYPLRYFGLDKKENNNTISILPDKPNNRILVGTLFNGVLVFDTLQRLIKRIKPLTGKELPSINAILKDNKGGYLLFPVSSEKLWRLSADLTQLTPVKISTTLPEEKSGIQYFGNPLYQNPEYAIVQSQAMLYRVEWLTNKVTEHQFTTSYTMGGLLYNNKIITHANDELIFLDAGTFGVLKKIPFKNTGYVRCFARGPDDHILMGTNNGIFKIDSTGKIISYLKKQNGLPDECIYAMAFDEAGSLWCSTNKGIFKLGRQGNILQLKKEDGLQENEFNTNMVATSGDGEIFFGGVNGVSSFYPAAITNYEENIHLLFTGIKANNENIISDTAAWNITAVTLPYNRSSLSFDFIAIANNNPEQYVYQYRMEGVDKQWLQNDGLQTVRYSLPPGKYTFKIYASRFFDKDAQPMKEIRIIIRPPFWKAWWFLSLLGVFFIGLLAIAINRHAKNKYEKKLQVLESERKIKLERERISRDLHDNLGAYANAVLYNTELLEQESNDAKKNELMKDLKFASKDIITSLRETVWALNKENYTAEDCLLRVRNFIQPLSRYYSHVNFSIEGEAPAGKQLHYTNALDIVRIIQEAVSNSIKHSVAKNITIHSSRAHDKWKITVSDDGKGFNYESAKQLESGNGLTNMQRRSTDSGFDFSIQSAEGKGTTITILA